MNKLISIIAARLLAAGATAAQAALKVLACEPEWGALVQELAGDKAEVYVATAGLQEGERIYLSRPGPTAARTASAPQQGGANRPNAQRFNRGPQL